MLKKDGVPVLLTREPGGTKVAEKIRTLVMDAQNAEIGNRCEVLLYLAARAQHVDEKIKPALRGGTTVLCDRFAEATFAYQGAGRGIDSGTLKSLNTFATGGLEPDLTFVFDITVDSALQRLRKMNKDPDRMEKNPRDFYDRIRESYRSQTVQHPASILLIDGERTVEQITLEVYGLIRKRFD
jgi:dTMP kinase